MNEESIDVSANTRDHEVEVVFESPALDYPLLVALSPDTARDLAFTLTKASYIAEGDESLL